MPTAIKEKISKSGRYTISEKCCPGIVSVVVFTFTLGRKDGRKGRRKVEREKEDRHKLY